MSANTILDDLVPVTSNDDLTNSITKFIEKNGVEGLTSFTQGQLDRWRQCSLNIAVTGNSGVGKSTLINTIRSLQPYDLGASPVNVIECTSVPKAYPHPENENLKFWDLPGVGTKKCPKQTYIAEMNFYQYDFFLIVSRTRFTENDMWLAKEINKMNKGFFFIRTQIDADIDNTQDEHATSFSEETLLTEIRNDCLTYLEKQNDLSPSIYLISGRLNNNQRWDYPRLMADLLTHFPLLKQHAFILAMSPICKDVVQTKIIHLRKRIWLVATASAAVAIIPAPFLSVGFDLTACIQETKVYRQQLGLTEDALRRLGERHQIPFERFASAIDDRIPIQAMASTGQFVISIAKSVAHSMVKQEGAKYIPFVGSAIASAASFGTTLYILNSILNDMEEAALKVQEIIVQSSANFN
ncbi:unnamed protein product [Rotaria sp. Silwood2]|nr:unnamed protein product [Rotaria sp. Silwood2]